MKVFKQQVIKPPPVQGQLHTGVINDGIFRLDVGAGPPDTSRGIQK